MSKKFIDNIKGNIYANLLLGCIDIKFMSPELKKEWGDTKNVEMDCININFPNGKKIEFLYPTNININTRFLVKCMIKIANIINHHFGIINNKNLPYTIHFLPINKKKIVETNNFGVNSFNSGETGQYPSPFYGIYSAIFRIEEAPKVLIHEMLHLYVPRIFLDNKYFPNLNRKILLVDESFVEFLACIINLCLLDNSHTNNIRKLLHDEIKFGFFQISKLLYLSGFKTYEEFITKWDNKFLQFTNVIEYFLIIVIQIRRTSLYGFSEKCGSNLSLNNR